MGEGGFHERAEGDAGLAGAEAAVGIDVEDVTQGRGIDAGPAEPAVPGKGHEMVDAALVDVGRSATGGQGKDLRRDGGDPFFVRRCGGSVRNHRPSTS